jgi:glycosyltransferase involved in cell wall biosynthesis
MRTVLFYRNFRKFKGGQLKVWDYFNHVLASPGFTAKVEFSPKSKWDRTNPWWNAKEYVVDSGRSVRPDVFFVAGRDWVMLDQHPDAGPNIPVVNLVQQVRHADPRNNRFEFLSRKAIRICVSEEVAQALRETGLTQGPLIVIPNGLDLESLPVSNDVARDVDVLIAAFKQPELGEKLERRLKRPGWRIEVLSKLLPRHEYLNRIRQARTTVFLPNEVEGFYLPPLEGMALETLVVCPDCVGNRSFCLPGHNAFRPNYTLEELVLDAESALSLSPDQAQQIRANAWRTVETHSLLRERQAFLDVLQNIDRLW